ncbi:MAG: hypothetical protein L3J32_11230 [Rhizobiaceae bacterium]|nr:hypothetical protein [Rhizobiaceae bacterium]
MNERIIEAVTFKLAKGVSDADFLKTVAASTDFIKAREGFIARRLSKGEDGTWLEHIEWENMTAAKSASDAFMKEPSLAPMMQAIDGASAIVQHNQLQISVG